MWTVLEKARLKNKKGRERERERERRIAQGYRCLQQPKYSFSFNQNRKITKVFVATDASLFN
jgi:hypothetical protein